MGEKLQLRLLGTPEISLAGVPVSEPILGKAQAILYYLAVTGRPQSRSTLATLLWGDMLEATARTNLRKALANLRRVVGSHLETGHQVVAFKPESDYWVDVVAFEAKVGGDSPTMEIARLEAGIELYRGDFLTGFQLRNAPDFETWLLVERERLRELLVRALSVLAAHHAERGELVQGIAHTRRLLALEPWREEAHRQLMLLLVCDGQRSAALAQYEICRQALAEELAVEPGQETQALYERIRAGELSRGAGEQGSKGAEEQGSRGAREQRSGGDISPAPRHNLPPQPMPFIGRVEELAQVRRLLLEESSGRLLTLTGPGGIGKTRLALEVAGAALEAFPNGVYFVRLASLMSAEHIVSTLAEYIGFRFYGAEAPKQQLLGYLGQKQMLLVLDNFEHLLASVELIAEILQAAPGVTLLVTSRERLNLSGETIYTLGGLALSERTTGPEVTSDAVALFLQRARLLRPDFATQADELNQIERICYLAQGMPLAIVLAAGWLEILSPQEIVSELTQSLDFLETEMRDVPERQRSMRAVFDYSWQRLSAVEQQTFMKLSLFRGGFTRRAAEVVTGTGLRILRLLANKSFIAVGQNGRYEIHELLRQYGEEQLQASGEVVQVRQAHSAYYLEDLYQREADLKGHDQIAALDEIEVDLENIRAAWGWALEQGNETAINQALESLHLFVDMRGLYMAGIEFFSLARRQLAPATGQIPGPVWGRILARLSFMQLVTMDVGTDIAADINRSLTIAEKYEEEGEIAFCLVLFGAYTTWIEQDPAAALKLLEQSRDHFQALNDSFYLSRALGWIGLCHIDLVDLADGERYLRQNVALSRQIGNNVDMVIALANLAEISFALGRYADAESYCHEAIALANQVGRYAARDYAELSLSLNQFLKGRLDEAKKRLNEGLALAKETNHFQSLAYATALFGLWAGLTGDNVLGRRYGRESLARPINDPFIMTVANWGLSMAHCNLKQYPAARQYLQEAFSQTYNLGSQAMKTWLLPVAAVILAGEDQKERAVELLALASTHPLSPTGWMEQWPLLTKLRANLEAELGIDRYQSAWERGQGVELEKVVMGLLAKFEAADHQPDTPSPSKVLTTPTTPKKQRFIQESLIASGGMGQVYQGRDTETGQQVAIKQLKPELLVHNPAAVKRFRREGEILGQLDHPNIVRVLAIIEAKAQPLIVMEYVPGGSLRDLLDEQPQLPLERILKIALELADALARVHHLNIIHRDLKPANVLLAADGTPRLTDFGIAHLVEQETWLTQEGAILGTSLYLSPEVWRGEELDTRSDIWSFGALMYEMLAGRPPFAGGQIAAIIAAILNEPLPDLYQFRPDAPPVLVALIEQMLVKEREQRPDSMRQLAAGLEMIWRS